MCYGKTKAEPPLKVVECPIVHLVLPTDATLVISRVWHIKWVMEVDVSQITTREYIPWLYVTLQLLRFDQVTLANGSLFSPNIGNRLTGHNHLPKQTHSFAIYLLPE